jgi:hypothetical protein
VRVALKSVTDTDSKAVARGLKTIDRSATVSEAEQGRGTFAEVWGEKDPTIVKRWPLMGADVIRWFEVPAAIRRPTPRT